MTGWQNWAGNVRCEPVEVAHPATEDEVATAVVRAAAAGREVRTAGRGHSFSPLCATDGTVLVLDRLTGVLDVDADAGRATVAAGTPIAELGTPLRAAGLAFANQGDIDRQAIAGAVGTGTHGTGPTLGSFSTAVAGVRLVDAAGEFHDLAPGDDRFEVARLSLGAAGVVTALTFDLVPTYRLHERTWREDVAECLGRLDERVAATRHYEFWWFPHRDRVESKALALTDADPDPLDDRRWERIGHSDVIFPSDRDLPFVEMEYSIPAEAGPAAFDAVRRLWLDDHPEVVWPIEYRTVAADDVWLSPFQGRASVTISIHQAVDEPWEAAFRDAEAVFRAYGGRPHWGKLHHLDAAAAAEAYPSWADWWRVRDSMDPGGAFLNDHLRGLAGR